MCLAKKGGKLMYENKKENAFVVEPAVVDTDRLGVQSPYNPEFYIYIWDNNLKKQVTKLVKRNQFDVLG